MVSVIRKSAFNNRFCANVRLTHSQLIYGSGQAIVADTGAKLYMFTLKGFTCGLQ